MKREFLTKLGIEKDAIDKIMAEHGKTIEGYKTLEAEKATLEGKVTELTGQVTERDKQIADIKKSAGDNKELTAKIATLEESNKTTKAEYDKKVADMQFNHTIDTKIAGLNPKNTTALKALLDMDKISIDKGNLIGFDDQIAAIKESDGYLFGVEADPGGGGNPANSKPSESELTDAEKNAIWGGIPPQE